MYPALFTKHLKEWEKPILLTLFSTLQEQQQSRLRALSQDERQCRSYLTLARETVEMFHYLTQVRSLVSLRSHGFFNEYQFSFLLIMTKKNWIQWTLRNTTFFYTSPRLLYIAITLNHVRLFISVFMFILKLPVWPCFWPTMGLIICVKVNMSISDNTDNARNMIFTLPLQV